MKQVVTRGIVLSRTDYGEADRIVTLLTPDNGKVRLIAKGVRRPLSKLAGGIELFSDSNITYLPSKGSLHTLISSRLITHYGKIVQDIDRTMFGYELLKILNKSTEEVVGEEYFDLLNEMLSALNDSSIGIDLIELVFSVQLLDFSGHSPNLQTDANGKPLQENTNYRFDFDHMTFEPRNNGQFSAGHIKLLRLAASGRRPSGLQKITGLSELLPAVVHLVRTLRRQQLRI
ncbi:MAG: repair protein RecO [Candidatus Saccharibacteria bacterium]|nr:repair protein RecO [Candidatus Saccharibacteria bacterium]